MGKGKEKEKELSPTEQFCKTNSKKDCPDRIVQNGIGGLLAGLFGGAAYRVVVDLANNRGVEKAATSAVARAPVVAVSCGIVVVVYTALECLTERLRGKRDSTNCFIAGAGTGAMLGSFPVPEMKKDPNCGCVSKAAAPRKTPLSLAMNALIGAIAFGVFDGVIRSAVCDNPPDDKKGGDKKGGDKKGGDKKDKKK